MMAAQSSIQLKRIRVINRDLTVSKCAVSNKNGQHKRFLKWETALNFRHDAFIQLKLAPSTKLSMTNVLGLLVHAC